MPQATDLVGQTCARDGACFNRLHIGHLKHIYTALGLPPMAEHQWHCLDREVAAKLRASAATRPPQHGGTGLATMCLYACVLMCECV